MLLNNYQNNTKDDINNNQLLWRPYNTRIQEPKIKEINNFDKADTEIQQYHREQKSDISKKVQFDESKNINYHENQQIEYEQEYIETDDEIADQENEENNENEENEDTESNNILNEDKTVDNEDSEYFKKNYKNNLIIFLKKNIFTLSIVFAIAVILLPIFIKYIKNKYIYLKIIKEKSLGINKNIIL